MEIIPTYQTKFEKHSLISGTESPKSSNLPTPLLAVNQKLTKILN